MTLVNRAAWSVTLTLTLAVLTGCQGLGPRTAGQRDGVFVHISQDGQDAHAVLMGLKMASLMAADHDVLVYFDLKGVNVVLQNAPEITHPEFEPARAQLQTLLNKGVPLYACPSCVKAAGKQPGDLLPGVKLAEKAAFFGFTQGRILTLDY